ncbi:MAG: YdcF family protein [Bacteroidota bacterium]
MKILVFTFSLILFCSCFFLGPSPRKRLQIAESVKPIDIAIVPGLPLYHGKWDTLLKSRLLWSAYLYKKGIVSRVLYSGNAVYTPWVEGPSMALFASQLGIANQDIVVDTIAEHSTENLFYGYHLAKSLGYKTVAIATDPFQCAMLHKYAKKHFKETIYFIPIIYDSIRAQMHMELEIDTALTLKKNFIPIEQRLDYKDRFKGTAGKNIKKG